MKNKTPFTVIVVLGMHRSGTSVITRGLQTMGVGLGHNLMPAIANNNDKGFFEDLEINALNMAMLKSIGSEWDLISPIEPSQVQMLNAQGYLQTESPLVY